MHIAAESGHLDVIKFLGHKFRERVHEKSETSFTPLHCAAQYGHCEVARYLIECLGMDPQDRDQVCAMTRKEE